ncbi:MAG: M23 family metallopeptidase [Patescibacteria group bacterium]|nr:M23 family metallopeptidase [Patescibacteria group bacterium]
MNPIKAKKTKQKIENNARYSLPFKDNILRVEAPAHKAEQHLKFCIDFLLPKETPIVTARSGTVIACQDGYKRLYKSPKFAGRGNFVIIRHTNKEANSYVHLQYCPRSLRGRQITGTSLRRHSRRNSFELFSI